MDDVPSKIISQHVIQQVVKDLGRDHDTIYKNAVAFLKTNDMLKHIEIAGYPAEQLTGTIDDILLRSRAQRRMLLKRLNRVLMIL